MNTKTIGNVTFDLYSSERALEIMEGLVPLTDEKRQLILEDTAGASRQFGIYWHGCCTFTVCAWQEEKGWLIARGVAGFGYKLIRHDDVESQLTHAYRKEGALNDRDYP